MPSRWSIVEILAAVLIVAAALAGATFGVLGHGDVGPQSVLRAIGSGLVFAAGAVVVLGVVAVAIAGGRELWHSRPRRPE